jgi:predicted metal-dependent HD superfamily phosphohydrolase
VPKLTMDSFFKGTTMYEHERLSPERLFLLEQAWGRLMEKFGVPPMVGFGVYDELLNAYAEPHRKYHTLEHVQEMLRVLGRLALNEPKLPALQLAVWLHDVVYDPKRSDNESASVDWFTQRLGMALQADVVSLVSEIILATRHQADFVPNTLEAIMLDSDLAILGSAEVRYLRYADAIRQEFSHVSDVDFAAGRSNFLQGMLARERIYHREMMSAEGEEIARANMQAERDRLAANLTVLAATKP